MDDTWMIYGLYMDYIWMIDGLYMDYIWIMYRYSGWWLSPTPLKNMSASIGMMTFPIYGKIKNGPNHQLITTVLSESLNVKNRCFQNSFFDMWLHLTILLTGNTRWPAWKKTKQIVPNMLTFKPYTDICWRYSKGNLKHVSLLKYLPPVDITSIKLCLMPQKKSPNKSWKNSWKITEFFHDFSWLHVPLELQEAAPDQWRPHWTHPRPRRRTGTRRSWTWASSGCPPSTMEGGTESHGKSPEFRSTWVFSYPTHSIYTDAVGQFGGNTRVIQLTLPGGFNPSEKYESIGMNEYSQLIWENISHVPVTTNQLRWSKKNRNQWSSEPQKDQHRVPVLLHARWDQTDLRRAIAWANWALEDKFFQEFCWPIFRIKRFIWGCLGQPNQSEAEFSHISRFLAWVAVSMVSMGSMAPGQDMGGTIGLCVERNLKVLQGT